MKTLLFALALVASELSISAIAAPSSPPAQSSTSTVELHVVGMNCSLCSEEMKSELKKIAGARDIEPRLECGKIYLALPAGAQVNDHALSSALLAKGFYYEGAKPASKSLADVRKTAQDTC